MPHMVVRGISIEQVAGISTALIEELAEICSCGTDNFMLECLQPVSIFEGKQVPTYPFIEIAWFERGQEIRDQYAKAVTKHVQSLGISDVEIAFKVYREDSYYINGEACGK